MPWFGVGRQPTLFRADRQEKPPTKNAPPRTSCSRAMPTNWQRGQWPKLMEMKDLSCLPCKLIVQVVLLPRSRTTTLVAAAPPAAAITPLFASTVGRLPRGKVTAGVWSPAPEMISAMKRKMKINRQSVVNRLLRVKGARSEASIDSSKSVQRPLVNGNCESTERNTFTLKDQSQQAIHLLHTVSIFRSP